MNTSFTTRAAALAASILMSLAIVQMAASYAYPEAPATRLASIAR